MVLLYQNELHYTAYTDVVISVFISEADRQPFAVVVAEMIEFPLSHEFQGKGAHLQNFIKAYLKIPEPYLKMSKCFQQDNVVPM